MYFCRMFVFFILDVPQHAHKLEPILQMHLDQKVHYNPFWLRNGDIIIIENLKKSTCHLQRLSNSRILPTYLSSKLSSYFLSLRQDAVEDVNDRIQALLGAYNTIVSFLSRDRPFLLLSSRFHYPCLY